MQLMKLLHKTFEKKLAFMHKSRLKNLMDASSTLIRVNKLTLTALGRNLLNKNKTRSNIKKMDRLLNNAHLQEETVEVYQAMHDYLINDHSEPWIHIDWSCLCSITDLYMLRAALSMQGRSIVIYEECHPKKNENNDATHQSFLAHLKKMLPPNIKPVIVTDAGFRAPWFKSVRRLGWDFVGRLRNKNAIKLNDSPTWVLSKMLYESATGTPTYVGEGLLTKAERLPVHFILYKGKAKNRHKLKQNKQRSQASKSNRHAKVWQEPWLLVTSLAEPADDMALKVVNIYRQRMRIEENIRDTKSVRYGFSLKESRTYSIERMKILLLIAAVAMFACWIAGIFMRFKGKSAEFQAHSSKFTNILSVVYLGREALKKGFSIGRGQFRNMLMLLFEMNAATKLETELCA